MWERVVSGKRRRSLAEYPSKDKLFRKTDQFEVLIWCTTRILLELGKLCDKQAKYRVLWLSKLRQDIKLGKGETYEKKLFYN
jgi:hypothetical protein